MSASPTASSCPAGSCSSHTSNSSAVRPRRGVSYRTSSIVSGTARINPGKVFDLELPLADAAEGYQAMDERRAIKVRLRP
jgi:hypothetical protein